MANQHTNRTECPKIIPEDAGRVTGWEQLLVKVEATGDKHSLQP